MGFLVAAAPYLALASSAIGAVGAISQGQSQAAMANYQAQVARNNAVIAQQYAENAIQTGEVKAYNEGLRNRQRMGALVAGEAAQGLDVNTGSAAQLRIGEQARGYTDAETVRQQAALDAYGYKVEGSNYRAQAGLDTAEAGFASEAGFLKAGGLMFGGLSNVAPKFQGLFDSANLTPEMWGGGGETEFFAAARGG